MQINISIIMSSLNVAKYIKKCMQSVIAQTLTDIEIICIDAGSTDGTFEILEEFAHTDPRISVICSDKKSYGYQMNLGIRAAHGEYIGIVETDDYVSPEMFERLYAAAEQYHVDFVKSGYLSFFENNDKRFFFKNQAISTKSVHGVKLDLSKNGEYRLADINHIWSGIYRRDFLLENDLWFNETPGASFQDTSFSILVGLMAKSCVYTDDCFYYYRTDRAESSVKSDAKYRCVVDEFEYIDRYLTEHGVNTTENRKLIAEQKLSVYCWNLMRLSEKSRALFCEEIKNEMIDFLPGGEFSLSLSEQQKKTVKLLTDPAAVIKLEEEQTANKRRLLEVIEEGRQGEKFVFVSAGRYLKKFLDIQEMFQCVMVEAVCDNSKELQGTTVGQYTILSVEETVCRYRDRKWLVVNKYHAEVIRRQLLELDVSDENIICITYMPDASEIYG